MIKNMFLLFLFYSIKNVFTLFVLPYNFFIALKNRFHRWRPTTMSALAPGALKVMCRRKSGKRLFRQHLLCSELKIFPKTARRYNCIARSRSLSSCYAVMILCCSYFHRCNATLLAYARVRFSWSR
jgi:hypothetical protein